MQGLHMSTALILLIFACSSNAYVTNRQTTERSENIANMVVLPGEIREPTSEEIILMVKNIDEENPPVTTESLANRQVTIGNNRMSITLTYGQLFKVMAEWQLKKEKEYYEAQLNDVTSNGVTQSDFEAQINDVTSNAVTQDDGFSATTADN